MWLESNSKFCLPMVYGDWNYLILSAAVFSLPDFTCFPWVSQEFRENLWTEVGVSSAVTFSPFLDVSPHTLSSHSAATSIIYLLISPASNLSFCSMSSHPTVHKPENATSKTAYEHSLHPVQFTSFRISFLWFLSGTSCSSLASNNGFAL